MNLRLGYFEEFDGANAVLIAGDAVGLRELADNLRRLENTCSRPLPLHALPFVRVFRRIELTAYPADVESGVRRTTLGGATPSFSWHHSKEGWLETAEKIEAVAENSGGGHAYLEAIGVEDAVVIVSKDEYDDAWWELNDNS